MKAKRTLRVLGLFAAICSAIPSAAVDKSVLATMAKVEAKNEGRLTALGTKLAAENPKLMSALEQFKLAPRDVAKSLGDQATDLVFVPTSPCRAVETRDTVGAFAVNETRSYDMAGSSTSIDFTDQVTGALGATPCTATTLNSNVANSVPKAALVAISVLSPTQQGFLNAWAFNDPEPIVATMLFSNNDTFTSSYAIVPFCQTGGGFCSDDISVKVAGASAHIAIDIYGYFAKPAATAFECIQTADTVQSVASGVKSGLVYSPACASGYSAVSTGCYWDDFGGTTSGTYLTSQGLSSNATQAYCQGTNFSGAARTLNVKAVCCRVPGR
jgi:hypothetical protein